jgi:predicted double-glycine peptidase
MKEFSYYWSGQRQTRTDDEFLHQLTKNHENQADVIEGIKSSERTFQDKNMGE